MRSLLAFAVLVVCVTTVACDDDEPTGPTLAPLDFTASLSGGAVRPNAVTTSATGTASLTATTGSSDIYDPGSNNFTTITYSVSVNGLSGPATTVELRGPANEESVGELILALTVNSAQTSGAIASGSFTSTSNPLVSGDSLVALLLTRNAYVTVKTSANPLGEIRGQVIAP